MRSLASGLRPLTAALDWPRAARHCWLALIFGLAVFALVRPYSHSVYDIYVGASRRWIAGEDIYVRTREYYRYSPLFAVVLTPLAVLPDGASAALWKLLNCGVFAWGLAAWGRRLAGDSWSRDQRAAQLLLAIPLSLHSMYNSQANLMMLGSLLLGMSAAAEEKWNRSALWLAWATLIKGYPLALAMLVGSLFPRRFAPRYLAALALGLLLPFAAHRPAVVISQYQSWLHHLADSTEIMRERLRSIDQLFVIYGQPLSQQTFAMVGLAGGAIVFLLCLRAVWQGCERRELLRRTFLWFSLWVALCGPATESCTYVVAAPTIAWAIVEAWRRGRPMYERAMLVASLLMMGPAVTDMFGKLIRNFANEHGSQPVGALFLLA
ncbi:MAG TPA: glycosyltransferase family 87 protein, partial [Pirellulales bacterium]|nr:glycosyltransferase family 87 protein [Pirellulales bacterium]